MEPKTTKKPRKPRATVISEAQDAYVEAILDGKSKAEAALSAGYSHGQSSSAAERSALVQNALAERREELSSATQITRAGVLNGILDAIEMARLQGEPLAMLAGYRDISKMMGYNAPEDRILPEGWDWSDPKVLDAALTKLTAALRPCCARSSQFPISRSSERRCAPS